MAGYVVGPYSLPPNGSWNFWFTPDEYFHDYNWLVHDPTVLLLVPRPRSSQPAWSVYAKQTSVILEQQGSVPNTYYRYYYIVLVVNPTTQYVNFDIVVQRFGL